VLKYTNAAFGRMTACCHWKDEIARESRDKQGDYNEKASRQDCTVYNSDTIPLSA